jgi:hypothetical protein
VQFVFLWEASQHEASQFEFTVQGLSGIPNSRRTTAQAGGWIIRNLWLGKISLALERLYIECAALESSR